MQPDQNTKTEVIYFYLNSGIDQLRVQAIMGLVTQVAEKFTPSSLYFFISSNGGSVDAGVTLYNFLKSLPQKILMHNIGAVDSIANVIFVAGDVRFASPHTVFMFHGVTWDVPSGSSLSLPQLNEITDRIERNHDTIAGIVADNTKMSKDELKSLFGEGKTLNVKVALEKGVIHEIKPAQIPDNAPFITINFNN